MTLNEWEQSNIEVLTSREMGEWLSRRENRLLDKIREEIKQMQTYDQFTGESYRAYEFKSDVLDIIDKNKGDKE